MMPVTVLRLFGGCGPKLTRANVYGDCVTCYNDRLPIFIAQRHSYECTYTYRAFVYAERLVDQCRETRTDTVVATYINERASERASEVNTHIEHSRASVSFVLE